MSHITLTASHYPTGWKRGDVVVVYGAKLIVTAHTETEVTVIRYRWYHRLTWLIGWLP